MNRQQAKRSLQLVDSWRLTSAASESGLVRRAFPINSGTFMVETRQTRQCDLRIVEVHPSYNRSPDDFTSRDARYRHFTVRDVAIRCAATCSHFRRSPHAQTPAPDYLLPGNADGY